MNTLQSGYKIYELTLTLSSTAAMVLWHLQFVMTISNAFLQCVQSNWLYATFTECHPVFVFSMSVRIFHDESSSWKSF